jgi:hypothetical protein
MGKDWFDVLEYANMELGWYCYLGDSIYCSWPILVWLKQFGIYAV